MQVVKPACAQCPHVTVHLQKAQMRDEQHVHKLTLKCKLVHDSLTAL